MSIPKTARDFALKHQINLGRDSHGNYFIREHGLVVQTTASAHPTATQAIGMMRKHLRQHRKEGSYVAKNPVALLDRPEFAVAVAHFRNSVLASKRHSTLADRALRKYGEHGPLISGAVRDHFPAAVKDELRQAAREVTIASDLAWAARPPRVRDATMRRLGSEVAKKYGSGFYGPQPRGTNPVKKNRKVRRNPMSAQARKDFARRMARARMEKQARKRIGIKRQIRRAGHSVDPNQTTAVLRAKRKAGQAPGMYNVGALSAEKQIAWWTGFPGGFSLLRGNAQGFKSLAHAKERARKLDPHLVVGIFRSDVSATKARAFLLGKK